MNTLNIKSIAFALMLGVSFLFSGCMSDYATRQDISQVAAVSREDMRSLRKEVDVAVEQVQNLAYRMEELEKNLQKVNDRIDAKTEEVHSRITRQMAEMQKQQNEQSQQLKRAINTKIDEINRILATLANTGPTAGGTETGFYHIVEENESLWSISRKYADYNVTVDDIKKANNISQESDTIKPGQKLFIPKR